MARAAHPGEYATPWLSAATRLLQNNSFGSESLYGRLPLWIGFAHREEITYLAVLLGLAYDGPNPPRTDRVDEERSWRVTLLVPYLGHIGLERFGTIHAQRRIRVVVNRAGVSCSRMMMEGMTLEGFKNGYSRMSRNGMRIKVAALSFLMVAGNIF